MLNKLFFDIANELFRVLPCVVVLTLIASFLETQKKRSTQGVFIISWLHSFSFKEYRRRIYMYAYLSFLVSVTLITRQYQPEPFRDVIGHLRIKYRSGYHHIGNIENILLFIPLCPTVMINFMQNDCLIASIMKGIALTITTTGLIEVLQAVLHLGTFQISDMLYNSIGGLLGLVGYVGVKRIVMIKKKAIHAQ